jgi:HSP20 family molecular chaperone IbpA
MPTYRKSETENPLEREIEEIRREMEELMSRLERIRSSEAGDITPLYTIYEDDNSFYYIIDIPYVETSDVNVKIEGNKVEISCVNRKGHRYKLSFKVPPNASANDLKMTKVKGRLKLSIPKKG